MDPLPVGNHELWLRGEPSDPRNAAASDSWEKWKLIMAMCADLDISTRSADLIAPRSALSLLANLEMGEAGPSHRVPQQQQHRRCHLVFIRLCSCAGQPVWGACG